MVEDLKRKLLIVLAVLLLLSSAQAGKTDRLSVHHCTDFQTANFLRGSKLNIQFLLFTSSSPSCGELILADDGIKNCSFNSSLETKIIIHGFRALGTKPSWIEGLVHAILHTSQVNVIAVDWVYGSTGAYPSAVENVTQLALSISQFISKLLALGISGTSIHIIGVSLGAHVGGLVGHFHGGQLGRITGLDPAGPKYTRASPEERLDPGDALFVEAIHTDADNFGIRIPVGHIDYFVNGGKDQPGCPRFISSGYKYLICDHMRAVHLYVSALKHPCPFMAFPCASHQDFLNGRCLDCVDPFLFSCPRIGLLEQAGVNMRKLPKEVKVYLMTSPSAPFCVHHSLVEFHLQKKRNTVTSIEITFCSNSTKDTAKITIPKHQEMGKRLLAHSVPLCQIDSVTLKYLPKNRFWRKDESSIVGKFCAAPLPLDSNRTMSCLPWNLTLHSNTDTSYELPAACA
ncbi:phospholipase A1 member A isoform X1 [Tyto alba]|uniref:phospholipase A1 member A isoform X1 n=1 Tax=Tyto alba TaxID=56313 RepID=UPI001402D544|nr:phospholipase A1 member A isoform X1 [Tyto alba]XP_042644841.1 phospholipase A1 member A isoform X1 [Tyto alba]XP_042644844.1 phospholipase A1 member A isoform X1 [Tyto alba]